MAKIIPKCILFHALLNAIHCDLSIDELAGFDFELHKFRDVAFTALISLVWMLTEIFEF